MWGTRTWGTAQVLQDATWLRSGGFRIYLKVSWDVGFRELRGIQGLEGPGFRP